MVDSLPKTFMVDEQSRSLGLLPMFHISGAGTTLGVLVAGGSIVHASGTSAEAVLHDLVDHRVTHVNLVPSLMSMLLAEPRMASADLAALKVVMYGAAPSSGTVVEEMMARVPQTTFVHGYGLTECAGGVAYMPPIRHGATVSHRPGLVGRPSAGCEIRIVDPDTLTDVTPGQPGEIWVRSERNIPGYWNRPDESAALYAEPGWLRTGDIGLFEGDDLILKDRLKDMIISGGENVYSAEVEHVAALHPAVAEAAAVGVPDARWGEVVAMVVTLRPNHSLEPGDLIEFCRQRLAHYKCPKSVHIVDDLPRTGNGKIMKRAIRDHLSAVL
jgi:long-chain acyl-CoA synthetase